MTLSCILQSHTTNLMNHNIYFLFSLILAILLSAHLSTTLLDHSVIFSDMIERSLFLSLDTYILFHNFHRYSDFLSLKFASIVRSSSQQHLEEFFSSLACLVP